MTDEQANKIIEALTDIAHILGEIRDIQKSWDEDDANVDLDNTDKYIL